MRSSFKVIRVGTMILLACGLGACESQPKVKQEPIDAQPVPTAIRIPPPTPLPPPVIPIDDYALLHDLMVNQQRVSGALLVPFKKITGPTRILIQNIADTSKEARLALEQMAADSPVVQIKTLRLSDEQLAQRKADEKTASDRIMKSPGREFERQLLLSEVEATQTALQLARDIAGRELDPIRSRWLADFAEKYGALYKRVQERLEALGPPPM
jgi:hypothetical protein